MATRKKQKAKTNEKLWHDWANTGIYTPTKEDVQDIIDESVLTVSPEEETLIPLPFGGALGIAVRYAQTKDSIRGLVTIRLGTDVDKVKFDFGNYGSGPIVRGGGDGTEPECP